MTKNQKHLETMMSAIQSLQTANKEKEERIVGLETRVSELEQYTRKDDIIITGLQTRHESYARATGGFDDTKGDGASQNEREVLETRVLDFLKEKAIPIESHEVSACHTLGRGRQDGKPVILMRLISRKAKDAILKNAKNLKGTGVYINEHLTKQNADIAKNARFLKKQNRIQNTWTRNCKIFIKTLGAPEVARVICIRNKSELQRYSVGL